MFMGYDDFGKGPVRLEHWPRIWKVRNRKRDLNDSADWGKVDSSVGYINFPYTKWAANGYNPFTGDNKKHKKQQISRRGINLSRARRIREARADQ